MADSSSSISQSPSPRHIPCRFRATTAAVETVESSPSSTPTILHVCQDEYSPHDDGPIVERDPYQEPQITLRDAKGRAPSEPDTNDEREPADSSFALHLQTRYRAHGSTSAPSTASTGQPGSSLQPTLADRELEERRQAGITVMLQHRKAKRAAVVKKKASLAPDTATATPSAKKVVKKKKKISKKGSAAASSSAPKKAGPEIQGCKECRVDGMIDKVHELQTMRETATQRRKDRLAKARQELQKKEERDAEADKTMPAPDEVPGPASAASTSVPCVVSEVVAHVESTSPSAVPEMPVRVDVAH